MSERERYHAQLPEGKPGVRATFALQEAAKWLEVAITELSGWPERPGFPGTADTIWGQVNDLCRNVAGAAAMGEHERHGPDADA